MVQVADHLSVADLQAVWRASQDATLARHIRVIWLLAEGRSCAEVARLTGFVRRLRSRNSSSVATASGRRAWATDAAATAPGRPS